MKIDQIIKLMKYNPELDFVKICKSEWHPFEDMLNQETVKNE